MCDFLTDPPNCPAMVAFCKASDYSDDTSLRDVDPKKLIITPDDTWGLDDYKFILECLKEGSVTLGWEEEYETCPRSVLVYNWYF